MSFNSKHNLDFEVAPWDGLAGVLDSDGFQRFRVGTCSGLWRADYVSYDILAITNDQPGNGHLDDVLEWFEQSCRRDHKFLRILEVGNQRFKKHLIEKRGFIDIKLDHVAKYFQ